MVRNIKKIAGWCIFRVIQCTKIFFHIQTGCCRFSPTCSEYAKEAVETMPALKAASAIIQRVVKCHPFNAGGYDPVHDKHDSINTKG